jgi:hypothetical protein
MTSQTAAIVELLSAATRARTVVASASWLSWSAGGEIFRAPCFEQGGSPVLLVERQMREQLLDIGYAATSVEVPALGVVRLGGELWPVAADRYLNEVRQFRLQHAECADCCGPRRTHLVGVRIDHVELASPEGGEYESVDLDAYAAAPPDEVIARGPEVAGHLNSDHHDDLVTLAAHLLNVSRNSLAAVRIEWIDSLGLEMAVIDEHGSNISRFDFRRPLTTIDELGGHLRGLFHQGDAEPG